MNRVTQLALNSINQRFYASIAGDWRHKRKHAWPGFQRLWKLAAVGCQSARVLDVGCGDGRFGQFLAELGAGAPAAYLGIDASPALLAAARSRGLGAAFCFELGDVVLANEALPAQPFDLIVLLGVLHHIPGEAQRCALLRALAERLSPGGILAFTFWRLDEDPRFSSRRIAFEDYNLHAPEPIDLAELESGDTLLRWDSQASIPRYCHFPSERERACLIAATGLGERAHFRADGHCSRMNEYVVLRAE